MCKYFKKDDFKAADDGLTHMLFMKKWEQNFYFKDIESDGRKFIERSITPGFFDSHKKQLNEINEEDEKSDDEEITIKHDAKVDDALKEKRTLVSSIYKNLQMVMELPGTSIERIRECSLSTKHGLPNDIRTVLLDIAKDDSMNPKPNSYLRLQDIYIRQKLDYCLNNGSDDQMTQHALIDLMLKTNEKTIKDWVIKLEDFKKTKTVISQDLLRFEEKVALY